jgi:hypothetical protein
MYVCAVWMYVCVCMYTDEAPVSPPETLDKKQCPYTHSPPTLPPFTNTHTHTHTTFQKKTGNGSLYGTLQGNTRTILHKFSVDLPKKHGRGGQSAVRFARLRMEARHNYVRKVAELAVHYFITGMGVWVWVWVWVWEREGGCLGFVHHITHKYTGFPLLISIYTHTHTHTHTHTDNKANVQGLIMAGSADFKTELQLSDLFDPRLLKVVIKTVDVSYGGMYTRAHTHTHT